MTAGPTWIAWFWWVGGWVFALAGLTLLLWAMFWDRSRGRRRCPRCWYDLSATTGLRCSECGYLATRARMLSRTRRRWRWAFVATVIVLGGVALHTVPRVQKDGWIGAVPTTVLVAVYPSGMIWVNTGSANRPLFKADVQIPYHLMRRVGRGESWGWQRRWMAQRAASVVRDDAESDGSYLLGDNFVPWGNEDRVDAAKQLQITLGMESEQAPVTRRQPVTVDYPYRPRRELPPTWIDWLWWIGGWALVIVGMGLLLRSFVPSPFRRERRNADCSRDMTSASRLRRSNSGFEANQERTFIKTRRRWRWALVAMLVLLTAYPAYVVPRVKRDGWFGAMPTTVLIAMFPPQRTRPASLCPYALYGEVDWETARVLISRAGRGDTWAWQRRWAAHQAALVLMSESSPGHDAASDILEGLPAEIDSAHTVFAAAMRNADPVVRARALECVRTVHPGDSRWIGTIIALADDESEFVRQRVPAALVHFTRDAGVIIPVLHKGLEDPSAIVRGYAARAIREMPFDDRLRSLVPMLNAMMVSSSEAESISAESALQFIHAHGSP